MEELQVIAGAFRQEGILHWGACGFQRLEGWLLSCRNRSRLPGDPRTVLCALFPYRSPVGEHNLSRYAVAPDYHGIVLPLLEAVARRLAEQFPGFSFPAFADNSPIPEVYAAALCGLGCIGDNGLLIHPEYGSWVFLGELVTDLPLPVLTREPEGCLHCGACRRQCPGAALSPEGLEKSRCLSHISQKKGALTPEEQELLRRGELVWGCDRCQECCPMNRGAKRRGMEVFQRDCMPVIRPGEAGSLTGRAFAWRPPEVLERNLELTASNRQENDITDRCHP